MPPHSSPTSLQTAPGGSTELLTALTESDASFNEALALIRGEVPDIRYHTTLPPGRAIHATRESASYAFGLLESGEAWRIRRANIILRRLVELQDVDERSPTYGIWSWFYEEPLKKMSPPDWNWADFIGTQLIQSLVRNGDRIEPDNKVKIAAAIRHAARSIIRRNVGMDYTNIAIMGTYVTLMAGEILGEREILDYGKNRLRRFAQFTREWGGFPEYNSPNYTVVALTEISRMLRDFRDPEDVAIVHEIHETVWGEIASHWHAPSGQWAGPHSRAYQTLLSPAILDFLQRGLGGRVSLVEGAPPSWEQSLLPIRCPDRYLKSFSDLQPARIHRQRIAAGSPALNAATCLSETFAVSSVERGTFWNQTRALLIYATGERSASALHVRFLRDGYDYSSANVIAAQEGADVLAAIGFANDGGNAHCSLDRIANATVTASDWRLRFEFQGEALPPRPPETFSAADEIVFPMGNRAWVALRLPWVAFGSFQPRWEMATQGGVACLDLVLYDGPGRQFVFDSSFRCALGLALSVSSSRKGLTAFHRLQSREHGGVLALEWAAEGRPRLQTAMPVFARKEEEIVSFAREVKTGAALAEGRAGQEQ